MMIAKEHIILLMILILCAMDDVRRKKISNLITFPSMAVAMIFIFLQHQNGLMTERLFGCFILFLFGMRGFLGMGDIKLMMVIELFFGLWSLGFLVMIASCYMIIYCAVFERLPIHRIFYLTAKRFLYGQQEVFTTKSYPFAVFALLAYITILLLLTGGVL